MIKRKENILSNLEKEKLLILLVEWFLILKGSFILKMYLIICYSIIVLEEEKNHHCPS